MVLHYSTAPFRGPVCGPIIGIARPWLMADADKPGSFEEAGKALDRELRRLLEFVNSKVVPAARQDAEAMLRRAADQLHEMADRLGRRTPRPPKK